MALCKSNEEFFQAVRDLIARLEFHGHREAAAELRTGFRCLNGVTAGWGLFLESIEKVRAADARRFDRAEKQTLDAIRGAARAAIYRR
jgi:hypothetical protein